MSRAASIAKLTTAHATHKPCLQAAGQVNTLFDRATQLQDRRVAQVEADTSLLAALHARGDLEGAHAVQQRTGTATQSEGKVPDACNAAYHAQSLALLLAAPPKVSQFVAMHAIELHYLHCRDLQAKALMLVCVC